MKTLTQKQTLLADMQVKCMRAIQKNHADILTWFIGMEYPDTLILQSVHLRDEDIHAATRIGFGVSLHPGSDVNDMHGTIEAHFYSL